jgi:hypothetical protein
MSIEDGPSSGRPSASTDDGSIEHVRAVVRKTRRLTLLQVTGECGISVG